MTGANCVETGFDRRILALGGADQAEQRIGHTAASGYDDGQAGMRIGAKNRGDSTHAVSIRDTRSAEFVNTKCRHECEGFCHTAPRLPEWQGAKGALVPACWCVGVLKALRRLDTLDKIGPIERE
jgi:hypothetical protein